MIGGILQLARFTESIDPTDDVSYILAHATRLIKVAAMAVISFGLTEGLSEILKSGKASEDDWSQAAIGFQDGTLMMAVIRVALLLDADDRSVSFQAINRRLKNARVQKLLLERLVSLHGETINAPTRHELIDRFQKTYAKIDWKVHGRLTHFRNLGVTHLTPNKLTKSVTFSEIRTLISIVCDLAEELQFLCQTPTAFRGDMLSEYKEMAIKALSNS